MTQKDPDAIRQESESILLQVSEVLRELATEIEQATRGRKQTDIDSLQRIARDLEMNRHTLLLLSNVTAGLDRLQPMMN